MNTILAFVQQVIALQEVEVLVTLLACNFVLGCLAAVKTGTFQLAQLNSIWKRIGIMLGGYLAVMLLPWA